MGTGKYFVGQKKGVYLAVRIFLVFLFVFAIAFFLWCLMYVNEADDQAKEYEARIERLSDDVEQLKYLVDAPLDDAYKIRIAREKLGMCFPDEIVFYTEVN